MNPKREAPTFIVAGVTYTAEQARKYRRFIAKKRIQAMVDHLAQDIVYTTNAELGESLLFKGLRQSGMYVIEDSEGRW